MSDNSSPIIPSPGTDGPDHASPAGCCGATGGCSGCQGCGGGACAWGDAGLRGLPAAGCGRSDRQLNTYDYLAGVPGNDRITDYVEVQFKNTRKGYYRNDNGLELLKGDTVAVEAQPGHDIGTVTLTGSLVLLQMKKANLRSEQDVKRVYRKARQSDIERYEEAKSREHDTMIEARQIAKDLELNMKIGDVEYQGDGNKAIFYYIADQRVDFRKLIKVLADTFHVRIEMRQIGARQEAGRIGGIGPCGRELCCATWMKCFSSVSTAAARFQDLAPNPQKLAGQCAKLKCCLNYEVDTYMEAARKLPERNVTLETIDGTFYFFKADILAGLVTYSTDRRLAANLVTITADRAREIIAMNAHGEKPDALAPEGTAEPKRPVDLAEQEDVTRFDRQKRNGGAKRNAKAHKGRNERPQRTAEEPQRNAEAPQSDGGPQREGKRPPRGDRPQRSADRTERRNNRRDNRSTKRADTPQRTDATRRPEGTPRRPAGEAPATPQS